MARPWHPTSWMGLPAEIHSVTLKALHTDAVQGAVASFDPNPLLGSAPPLIDKSERSLPRSQRVVLAQLRSGHCRLLESYKLRVGRATSAICPECQFQRHTTRHLFSCPAVPTHLSISDLWNHPPSFSSLIPPDLLLHLTSSFSCFTPSLSLQQFTILNEHLHLKTSTPRRPHGMSHSWSKSTYLPYYGGDDNAQFWLIGVQKFERRKLL